MKVTFQMNFLRALIDGVHEEFTSQEILKNYQLGTSTNIQRIKDSLLKKDLIDISRKKVTIPDPVFRAWLKQNLS